jgi:hypothetical protein
MCCKTSDYIAYPVHAGGFHGDGIDTAGLEPVGQDVEVDRETGELPHRFVVPVRRHGNIVGGAANAMPAALGWVIVRADRDLPGLRGTLRLHCAMACSTIQFGMWRRIGYVV